MMGVLTNGVEIERTVNTLVEYALDCGFVSIENLSEIKLIDGRLI